MSRWPIRRQEVRKLPRVGRRARATTRARSAWSCFAEVDGPRGPIQVYCAHLSWRDDHSAIRQVQVADDLPRSFARNRPRTFPAVLCGDLNAEPHSDEIRMLTGLAAVPVPGVMFRDAWLAAGHDREPGYTCDERNPFVGPNLGRDMRIDYVMVGNRNSAVSDTSWTPASPGTPTSTGAGRPTTSRWWPRCVTDLRSLGSGAHTT